MKLLLCIALFTWSVTCSSVIQGQKHVFSANFTSTPASGSTSSNNSINANVSSNATAHANLPFQNLTDQDPFKSRAASVQNLQSFGGALAGIQAPPILMSSDKSRPFLVQGDTFSDFSSAGGRTCDKQYSGCSNAANSKSGNNGKDGKGQGKGGRNGKKIKERIRRAVERVINIADLGVPKENANADTATAPDTFEKAGPNKPKSSLSISDCDAQKNACNAAQKNAPFQSFNLENVGPDPEMPEFDLLCAP
ncbi:hypothetical protein E2P81_ATG07786 [Venturia nashicola]|uniref:Uncharacterized protein n=1 Tax=Venturia nashicola TaxID=86259 RepID=A0A4Z1P2B7_9PEZI|nr:hypothetical protein E6O75_ATG07956 [Venturia nashicola]TLD22593.1 hypothetical protein E2P81_ATG07786 [Venturia nashicola]